VLIHALQLNQYFRFVQNTNERENFMKKLHLQIGYWTLKGEHEQSGALCSTSAPSAKGSRHYTDCWT